MEGKPIAFMDAIFSDSKMFSNIAAMVDAAEQAQLILRARPRILPNT
jgi:hypothetical protein